MLEIKNLSSITGGCECLCSYYLLEHSMYNTISAGTAKNDHDCLLLCERAARAGKAFGKGAPGNIGLLKYTCDGTKSFSLPGICVA